jgi:hypothetical protein
VNRVAVKPVVLDGCGQSCCEACLAQYLRVQWDQGGSEAPIAAADSPFQQMPCRSSGMTNAPCPYLGDRCAPVHVLPAVSFAMHRTLEELFQPEYAARLEEIKPAHDLVTRVRRREAAPADDNRGGPARGAEGAAGRRHGRRRGRGRDNADDEELYMSGWPAKAFFCYFLPLLMAVVPYL